MSWARSGLLFAVFLLTACDHHKKVAPIQSDTSAPLATDSAYTGEKSPYPRALPVALPVQPLSQVASAPALKAPAKTSTTTETPSTPAAPEVAEALPPSSPNAMPATNAVPVTAAAPASDAVPDPTRPAMMTPPPVIATLPPRAMSDLEAQKQVVVLETSFGRIVIELDDVAAPRTCGNFRKLVSDGFYDHTVFHRVIPHFMIQGGDPNSKTSDRATYGQGDPGYTLPAEIQLKHVAGAVAMARLPDSLNPEHESNGSQFFICAAACPSLDGQYTVFGRVIQGMDVVDKIANQPRDQRDDPVDRIEMRAQLETKRQALESTSASP